VDDRPSSGHLQRLVPAVIRHEDLPDVRVVLAHEVIERPNDLEGSGSQVKDLPDGLGSGWGQKDGHPGPREEDV